MKLAYTVLTFLLFLIPRSSASEPRPNIVIFYLDDMGWAQPGAYGGIRVTWMAQWKGRFPANRVVSDPVIQLDVLPTALAACRQTSKTELDGVNLLPLLEGKADKLEPRELYFRFGVQHAVRQGYWKLVKASKDMDSMLVNLATDPGEQRDLSAEKPAKKAELTTPFKKWDASMPPPRWQDNRWNGDPDRKAAKKERPEEGRVGRDIESNETVA